MCIQKHICKLKHETTIPHHYSMASRYEYLCQNLQNLPFSNPKPEFHNISANTKFGENPMTFTNLSFGNKNMDGQTNDSWMEYDRQTEGHMIDGQSDVRLMDGETDRWNTWSPNMKP